MNKSSIKGVGMSEETAARRGRGRRPAAEVRAAVLAAAGRILLQDGMQAVTFDRVAVEAGSSKTTLYKWWPSPGVLAAEAYFALSRRTLEFPDTGDIRADLIAQLTAFVRYLKEEGAEKPVSELLGAAQLDPGLARAWSESYALPRRALARERLRVAVRQGQLREDADLDIIVDQLWGACYHRLLVLRVPFDESLVERLVDQALYGSAPHGAHLS
ncbi:TetR family transcriptional regulator [Nonomuraea fuscirosea]|uniref:TetR family transcriptional regulator n=2 Tax=Nonomuraea fuscirosea TaxID=1291556 RepID=A0A2T0M5A1_9ACTN|nr:TetR family transcriptional regulator [Nonomuraea fuscirosea]